jgi:hypothetical protein
VTSICAELLLFSIGGELRLFSNHRPSYPQNFFKKISKNLANATLLREKIEKNSEEKTGRPSETALKFFPEGARKIEKRHRGRRLREGGSGLFSGQNPMIS